jgi:lysophospholipase L1-like esterase
MNSSPLQSMRRQKRMVYINVFDAMLNDEGQPRPELYREDGLHPTAECYALWQKIIAPYLR